MSSLQFSQIRNDALERGEFSRALLRQQWLSATASQRRRVRFVTAGPKHPNVSWKKFLKRTGRFNAAVNDKGARIHIVAVDRHKDGKRNLHFHAVIFMPRKWRNSKFKTLLADHKLCPCGDPKKAIQKVKESPTKLWCYVAGHMNENVRYEAKSHK